MNRTTWTIGIVASAAIAVLIIAASNESRLSNLKQRNDRATSKSLESAHSTDVSRQKAQSTVKFLSKAQRGILSDQELLHWLEAFGEVPIDAVNIDREWQLAQRTSWWGKPIDPTTFWQGRVLWLDNSAYLAARRKGRGYPPMPYDDPTLPKYQDEENPSVFGSWDIEGPNIRFESNSREAAFWHEFSLKNPKPPEEIERQQFRLAERLLKQSQWLENQKTTRQETEEGERIFRRRALDMGFPSESLSDEALFGAYVIAKREEYQKKVESIPPGQSVTNNLSVELFLRRLAVNQKHITEPLSDEQVRSANAWKIEYLRRLRKEGVNQSYINAYLSAWQLSPSEVFGE